MGSAELVVVQKTCLVVSPLVVLLELRSLLLQLLRADEASQQHVAGLLPLHGHVANPGVCWFPVTTLLFPAAPGGNNEATPPLVSCGNGGAQHSAGFPAFLDLHP